jgi:glycosyltransferase involved in cell wall biosynthesis
MNGRMVVFFTYGVSLRTWKEFGLLEREVKLYNRLVERGVAITFVTYGDASDHEYQSHIPGIRIEPFYQYACRPRQRYLRLLHSLCLPWKLAHVFQDAQLIKTKQVLGGWNAVLAKWLHRVPLLLRCGFEPNEFAAKQGLSFPHRAFLWASSLFAYRFADLIVVATGHDQRYIERRFKVPPTRFKVIPNWVDVDAFVDQSAQPSGERRAVTVCRLAEQKNIPATMRAFHAAGVPLDIVGYGPDEAALATIISLESLNVRLLGRLPNDELPGFFTRYDVFALCSHYEGNPKSLLEAMSSGKIIIATDVPGIRDVVTHGQTGVLSDASEAGIRASVERVFADLPAHQQLGANAAALIRREYSLEGTVDKERSIYHALGGSRVTA